MDTCGRDGVLLEQPPRSILAQVLHQAWARQVSPGGAVGMASCPAERVEGRQSLQDSALRDWRGPPGGAQFCSPQGPRGWARNPCLPPLRPFPVPAALRGPGLGEHGARLCREPSGHRRYGHSWVGQSWEKPVTGRVQSACPAPGAGALGCSQVPAAHPQPALGRGSVGLGRGEQVRLGQSGCV